MVRFWMALLGAAWATVGAAEVAAPALRVLIDEAARECADFENGTLDVPDDAAQRTDLTGDGRGWVLDYSRMGCSTMASFACGTGGCRTAFVVGDHVTETLAYGWSVVDMSPFRVIVMQVHGSRCGGIGPIPCFEAMAWDGEGETFTTVAPPIE